MLRVFLSFLMTMVLIGCMSQQESESRNAIISDDDFLTPEVSVDETGSGEFQDISAQLNQLVDSEELVAPPQNTDTNIQARTIAGTEFEGYACSIVSRPGETPRWSIVQQNLETNEKTVLVEVNKNRKIQSVACSQDGELALFSMQESLGGDFEIYLAVKSTATPHQLTDNDVDDLDVTASSSLDIAAWRTVHADGRLVIDINQIGLDGTRTSIKTLGSGLPFYQPALSSGGRWLVFTQLSSSKYRIIRYQISTGTSVRVSEVRRSKKVFHPSISDDGNLVGWVENNTKNLFWVKNVNNNTKSLYLNNANGIEHAMLTGDGDYVVYGVVKQRRTYIKHLHTTTKFQLGEVLEEGQSYLGASYSVPAWLNCIDKREECRAYFTVVHRYVLNQDLLFRQAINKTATDRIVLNNTIGLVFDLLAVKGLITEKDRLARNFNALNTIKADALNLQVEQMSASYQLLDSEYGKLWKDLAYAFIKAATSGRFDEVYKTLLKQSAAIVVNFGSAWDMNELSRMSRALSVADKTVQELLYDGADLSKITYDVARSAVIKQGNSIGDESGAFGDYSVSDAVAQLYVLIGFIEQAVAEIEIKLIFEGKDLLAYNNSIGSIYNLSIVRTPITDIPKEEEACKGMGAEYSLFPLMLSGYYSGINRASLFSGLEDECASFYGFYLKYQLHSDVVYEKGYTYWLQITDDKFVGLQPPRLLEGNKMVANQSFLGACPKQENHNAALKGQKIYQNTYLNRSSVGMEYFSETACNSYYHDNDPFVTQDGEQVHNLVDLPSHYLYSLEDYEWSDEEQRLLTRVKSFFGGVQTGGDDRIPLILIHGWQGDYDEDTPVEWFNNADSAETYWQSFIGYMQTSAHRRFFAKKYKPYVFRYPSFKRVSFNGRMLRRMINSMPELKDKQVAIVSHSMGGLVARSWIEEQDGNTQLDKLITLATPHHGSPSAISSWVDSAVSQKSLQTPGALDLMWDNFDDVLQTESKDLGNWLQQKSDTFGIDLSLPPFDLYHYRSVQDINRQSNPWLTKLNKKQSDNIRKKYYHYASYNKANHLIDNTLKSIIGDVILELVNSRYYSDGVVPDMSGFNLKEAPPVGSIVYSKTVEPFYVKVASNNDRYIEDVDHILFKDGIDNKFHVKEYQLLMLSYLLNSETIPGWGNISDSNAYDPLFLMIKQDLGFKGVLGLTASTQNGQQTLTWDKYSGIRRYDIRYNEQYQGGSLSDYIVVNNVKSPYVIPAAQDGVTRHYQIRYIDNGGFVSNWSNAITIGTPVVATGKLNDTGITQCADRSTHGLSCPVTDYPDQDAQYGRDFNNNDDSDGHAGFSFTKLDANGNELLANATNWSCVKDNVTGLIWEVKQGGNGTTGDEGLHDADDRYNWYTTDTSNDGGSPGYQDYDGAICHDYRSGNAASYCNTEAYANRVNAQSLCGSSDWRLPTREELRSIVSYDIAYSGPTIEAEYFPNTINSFYWSSSPYASRSNYAWDVGFHVGNDYTHDKSHGEYVRLVRGGQ